MARTMYQVVFVNKRRGLVRLGGTYGDEATAREHARPKNLTAEARRQGWRGAVRPVEV